MEMIENGKPLSAGEQKVQEYAERIRKGESRDAIIQGLPESFRSAIDREVGKSTEQAVIPPQYAGMSAEAVDFIWTIPEYIDPEKTKQEKEKKEKALEVLRAKESDKMQREEKLKTVRDELGIAEQPRDGGEKKEAEQEEYHELSVEERKKLNGWAASYELAKIAKHEGVDLAELSREEYAQFAIDNALAIDDSQLRVAPWQRMGASVEELVARNKEQRAKISEAAEKAFAKFCFEMKQKAGTNDRSIEENIRVRQGTKDSDSWLFFGINSSLAEGAGETYKAYVSVKDLNTLSPKRFIELMKMLRDAKYNGDIKIFQDLSGQGTRLNDQIVMHGNSQEDSLLALRVAEQFFGNDLDQKGVGKDEVIDGKNQSYSQILAKKIKDEIHAEKK